jgi:zinc and cadmium transporter
MEFIYAILSVLLISLISLAAVYIVAIKELSNNRLLYIVSFAAGALFGDIFFHLLPEYVEINSFTTTTGVLILLGIVASFILESVLHWRHCHNPSHKHTLAHMNLFGDALHNMIDGVIIGAAYLINVPTGIATTTAVLLHEIPQEVGDAGVLLHSGYSKAKALLFNGYTALSALLGVVLVFIGGSYVENIEYYIVPFAIGNFLYIAGSDLIPELHKNITTKKAIIQTIMLILGMVVMSSLLLLE